MEQQIQDSENPFLTKLTCPNQVNTIPFMLVCIGTCDFFIGKGVSSKTLRPCFLNALRPRFSGLIIIIIDHHGCCVHLELLRGQTKDCTITPHLKDDDITSFLGCGKISKFIRTGICIIVDLSCFCGIECLSPVFAKSKLPIPVSPCEKKEKKCEDREKFITEELCGLFGLGNVTVWKAVRPGVYLEGKFEIFNDGSSLENADEVIKAQREVPFPTVSQGTTVSRDAIMPSSFTISAPSGTSGRYCITLLKCVPY